MYAQLGNIVFESEFGFTSFAVDGDESNLAEFELINSKPRLQKIGDSLQQLTIGITLHARFVNISNILNQLTNYKTDGEILPLLMGNGRYVNDYVIVSMPFTVIESLSDGSIVEAALTLTLKEFVSNNKLEQKKAAARRKAFAVGEKKNVILRAPQPLSITESSAQNITGAKLQSIKVDMLVTEFENNAPKQPITADKIKEAATKGKENLNSLVQKIDSNIEIFSGFPEIKAKANDLIGNIESIISAYPYSSVSVLKALNLTTQSSTRNFTKASTPFLQQLIVRNG